MSMYAFNSKRVINDNRANIVLNNRYRYLCACDVHSHSYVSSDYKMPLLGTDLLETRVCTLENNNNFVDSKYVFIIILK